jgi:AcrR family transcriptional regulator
MKVNSAGTAPVSRATRRREDETLRIVKIALTLFLDRGPDQVTADEIAEAASISRRTFFRYFPSKDDVLVLVHGRGMRRVAEHLRDRPAGESFVVALVNANRSISETEVDAEERALAELSTRLLSSYPEVWERIIRQVGREFEQELETAIASRLRNTHGDVRSAGPLAAVAWSVGCSVFRDWLADGAKGNLWERIERALHQIAEAL